MSPEYSLRPLSAYEGVSVVPGNNVPGTSGITGDTAVAGCAGTTAAGFAGRGARRLVAARFGFVAAFRFVALRFRVAAFRPAARPLRAAALRAVVLRFPVFAAFFLLDFAIGCQV
jgi:hypothetical protein